MMMSALRVVGLGGAPKHIISQLLDVEAWPRGAMYSAEPWGLTLVDAEFDDSDIHWRWDQDALVSTAGAMAHNVNDFSTKSALLQHMMSEVV